MKRLYGFIISLVVIAALVSGVLIAPSFIDWSKYKGEIQKVLAENTGYELDIRGRLSVSLIPEPALFIEDFDLKVGNESLASIKRLDFNIDPMPLLGGDVIVRSLRVVGAEVLYKTDKDGKSPWMTPKIEAMMSGEGEAGSQGASFLNSVSLQRIDLQGATLLLSMAGEESKDSAEQRIDFPKVMIVPQTLQGPYSVKGQVDYSGQSYDVDANVGALEKGAKSVSLSANVTHSALQLKYGGAIGLEAPFESQGEAEVIVSSLGDVAALTGVDTKSLPALPILSQSGGFSGMVLFSKDGLIAKKSSLALGEQDFDADLLVRITPMKVDLDVAARKALDLNVFMPPAGKAKPFDPNDLYALVPKEVPLPKDMDLNVGVKAPDVVYKEANLGKFELSVAHDKGELATSISLAEMPGSSKAVIDASVTPGKIGFNVDFTSKDIVALDRALKVGLGAMQIDKSGETSVIAQGVLTPKGVLIERSDLGLQRHKVNAIAKLEGVNVNADIQVHGAQIKYEGAIQNGSFINNAKLSVKHESLASGLASFSGVKADLSSPLARPLSVSTVIDEQSGGYAVKDIKGTFGPTNISGALEVQFGSGKPSISGDLSADELILQGQKQAAQTEAPAGKRWSEEPIVLTGLDAVDARIKANINTFQYDGWILDEVASEIFLKDGILDASFEDAETLGGTVDMNVHLEAHEKGIAFSSRNVFEGVQIEPMITNLIGTNLVKGAGTISGKMNVTGEGETQLALVKSLSGDGAVNGQQLLLKGFDLQAFSNALRDDVKPGDTLSGIWTSVSAGGETKFDTLEGTLLIEDGVIKIPKLDLISEGLTMKSFGKVDLPAWEIHLQNNMIVKAPIDEAKRAEGETPEEIPPFTLIVKGPLDNPAQGFAQGAINDYVERKLNRKLESMLSDKLGEKFNNKEIGAGMTKALGGMLSTMSKAKAQAEQKKIEQLNEERRKQGLPEVAPDKAKTDPNAYFNDLLEGLVK